MEIQIKNLCKSFDGEKVLDNVNMTFTRHKPVCVMAPSGRGKTTLINIILGLIPRDRGSVQGTENMKFSAVFQEDRLCEDLSAVMNVAIVCENPDREKIQADLQVLGLTAEETGRPVKTLSGGQKRRVAISRRLESDSHTIIMDEPFKGLDEETRRIVVAAVKEKLRGRILLIITHDEKDAADFAADIIYI